MAASPFCGAPSGKVQLAGQPRRRQPLVVLSLLLNLLLLGASATWWSGSFTLSANGRRSGSRSDIAPRRRAPVARGADAWEACERAQLDVQKLADWGCTVFDRVCFDQDGIILHDGRKTPSHPDYTDQPLFKVVGVPSYVLPGYAEPLGTAHFLPKCWDLRLRGPTHLDPPDIWQPAEFTNCTVPLVWWPTYFSIFADLFIGSALALDAMQAEGAFDRNVLLAPVSLGMDLPPMYRSLLGPYSRHQPMSFSALSSREHAITGRPRCFERAALCNLVGMYISSPEHHWPELLPKTAGRRAVEHFRREHPEEFAQQDQLAAADNGTVFRVAFQRRSNGMRMIRNLPQVLEECKQWRPPKSSRFTSVDCILLPDGTAENHVKIIAQVQNVHALVNTHGSGLTYSFFMPGGTGVVEILAWNFHGEGCTWADQYFSEWFELDHSVNSGYFRLVADKDHTFPGPFERKNVGSSIAWGRDADIKVHFPSLAKALQKVALGELETTAENSRERTFYMQRRDICEGHQKWLKEHNMDADGNTLPPKAEEKGQGGLGKAATEGQAAEA